MSPDRIARLEAVADAATAMAAIYAAGANKYQRRRARERLGDALAALHEHQEAA